MSSENDKIVKRIQKNEFNIIEFEAIIASYERNLKEKEDVMAAKEEKVSALRERCDVLNQKIDDKLGQMVSIFIRARRRSRDAQKNGKRVN